MALPSTILGLNAIYQESTSGFTGLRKLGGISYNSWAQGPLGSSTYTYNGYGMDGSGGGVPVGGNVIYGFPDLSSSIDPTSFAEFRGNQFYIDGTTFNLKYSYTNPLTNPPPPPPPGQPIDNSVTVQVDCYDYNGVYTVHNNFNIIASANSSQGATTIPGFTPNTSPLVDNVYWAIQVNTVAFNTISAIAFSVNGTTVYSAGGGGGNFTWTSAGASQGYTNSSGIEYNVTVS